MKLWHNKNERKTHSQKPENVMPEELTRCMNQRSIVLFVGVYVVKTIINAMAHGWAPVNGNAPDVGGSG